MILEEIALQRIVNHQLENTKQQTAKELVSSMAAMQAQDFNMSMWAVGMRLPQATEQSILKAFNNGDIIRTHVLRPTWHLVSADDISWMLALTAPQIKTITNNRDIGLGIDQAVYSKTNDLFIKVLEGGNHLTVDELKTIFADAKIKTDDNWFYHFTMRAELDGIICSGAVKNKKQTYALLSERVSNRKQYSKDEALAALALRYFTSHGPACLKDFVWWSGLSVGNARKGLETVKSNFQSVNVEGETYWFKEISDKKQSNTPSIHFTPAFDEIVISYRNRKAVLLQEHQSKAFSSNGIFRPVIVINGHGQGIWKRTIKKDSVVIEPQFFTSLDKSMESLFNIATEKYGTYLGLKTVVKM
jgi:hypothetical protein